MLVIACSSIFLIATSEFLSHNFNIFSSLAPECLPLCVEIFMGLCVPTRRGLCSGGSENHLSDLRLLCVLWTVLVSSQALGLVGSGPRSHCLWGWTQHQSRLQSHALGAGPMCPTWASGWVGCRLQVCRVWFWSLGEVWRSSPSRGLFPMLPPVCLALQPESQGSVTMHCRALP